MTGEAMSGINEDLSEITLPAPVWRTSWGQVTYPPGGRLGPRWQPHVQLVAVHAGAAEITLAPAPSGDGEISPISLGPGEMTVLRPGRKETFRFAEDCETVHSWCHLEFAPTGQGDRRASAIRRALAELPAVIPLTETMATLKDLAVPLYQHHAESGCYGRDQALLSRLGEAWLAEAARQARQSVTQGFGSRAPAPDAVVRAERYMAGRLDQPIDLAALAEAAHLSPNRLIVLFREHRGHTPIRWLWRLRTRRAVELLRHTGLSLDEIAARTGFATPYHLSRKIKQLQGASPLALRRRWWSGCSGGSGRGA